MIVFITHGSKLFQNTISIDTEIIINETAWQYENWANIGRPSLMVIKANPYLANTLTLIGLLVFCVLFGYFVHNTFSSGGKTQELLVVGAIFITAPILAEQLAFDLQSVEITLGFITTLLAAWGGIKWTENSRFRYAVVSIALAVFSFFIYQSFAFIYVIFIIEYFFLRCFGQGQCIENKQEQENVKWAALWRSILLFGVIMGIYGILMKVFFSGSDYLNSNNYWAFSTTKENIARIFNNFYLYFSGDTIFHTAYTCIFYILLFPLVIIEIRRKQNKVLACVIALGELLLPFLMVFVLGGPPQSYRAEIDVVVAETAIACSTVMLVNKYLNCNKSKFSKLMLIIVSLIILLQGWEQLNITQRLYYTDRMCYENDVMIAHQIGKEINSIIEQDREYPVYISGKRKYENNAIGISGEAMGKSFFGWGDGPHWHNKRALHFMRVQGYSYEALDEEECLEMSESNIAEDMPIWPVDGSIALKDGVIVVKLSE